MVGNRLFISWSRSQASAIAPLVKTFCQDVLGIEDIFLSNEIDSGRRWSDEIADALENCNAGLIIVTDENKGAPWLNFEAGAISKRVADANVIPLLWDISVGDIADTPLNQFQSKTFEKDDILFVMQSLAKVWDLSVESISRRFEAMYPALEAKLREVPAAEHKQEKATDLQDLYGLIQRMGSRLSGIEAAIENFDGHIAAGIFGQSEFATASPRKAADLLSPYFAKKAQQRNALSDFATSSSNSSSNTSNDDLIAQALTNQKIGKGDRIVHLVYGQGLVSTSDDDAALVDFDDGLQRVVSLQEIARIL